MEATDISPLKNMLSTIAVQLVIGVAICALVYFFTFIILRAIKVPPKIANLISGALFLVAIYYLQTDSYLLSNESHAGGKVDKQLRPIFFKASS